MVHSRLKRIATLSLGLTFATLAYAFDYSDIPVDESALSLSQPLGSQPEIRSITRYEMLPHEIDRRFTCFNPATSVRFVVDIHHTNDLAHTATLQLINPVGVVEASFLSKASRLPRYPDINLDSYKVRFGEELSTLVINAQRLSKSREQKKVSGLLQTDQRVEIVTCTDELFNPNSLVALDAPFESQLNEVLLPAERLPKSMCSITTIANNKAKFICSAVLIGPNLALTANHCLAKIKDQSAQLNCGANTVARINVKESVSNPIHDQEQWRVSSDVAILKLESDIALPPALLAATPSEGADLLFAQTDACGAFGYGNQFDGRGGILHGVKFATPPEELGGLNLSLDNFQSEKLITSDPRFFLRPGDSGGGVICKRGDEDVVVGIHSFSFPIDSTVNSASVGHNFDWLIEQINKINGVNEVQIPSSQTIDPSQDPNLGEQSALINSENI